ncbi:hypothetical protein DL89DRAFT_300049 [Linderina pennispora]|uniref:Cytochrome P450 n=1 Tax=Linderina pennispora TaxID=61395 RepID=A0A1Y1WLW5_9FUNG|nr:uncharacterized protein DL89DRAFT_300049 [Linderina pennispora]ORX74176.1 hypothetical protein DL89DRAFT_300049 [Linderina pennispora]
MPSSFWTLLLAFACYLVINALFLSPLRNIPGPFIARLSGLRASLIHLRGANAEKSRVDHAKYGPIYVMAPNMVAVSSQEDIRTVLGTHAFRKSKAHYKAVDLFGIENLFSARTPALVNQRKRQLGPYLGLSYLAKMEPAIMKAGNMRIEGQVG